MQQSSGCGRPIQPPIRCLKAYQCLPQLVVQLARDGFALARFRQARLGEQEQHSVHTLAQRGGGSAIRQRRSNLQAGRQAGQGQGLAGAWGPSDSAHHMLRVLPAYLA